MSEPRAGFFTLYGLLVRSAIALPELAPAQPPAGERADVDILLGPVPEHLEGAAFYGPETQYKGAECLIAIPEVARFRVRDGATITLRPEAGADPGDVRAFLFGIAFGVLLHQRRLIPLHLSAVVTPYGVWAFTGESGAGKSTTAGTLNRMTGWPLLCDDVAVLDPQEDAPILHGGMRRLKLWNDAVDRFGLDPALLQRDLVRWEKFHVSAPEIFDTTARRLSVLFDLRVGERMELVPIRGARAFQTVINAVYRPAFAQMFGDVGLLTRHCARVADTIQVHALTRPWSVDSLGESLSRLIDAVSQQDAKLRK